MPQGSMGYRTGVADIRGPKTGPDEFLKFR